MSYPRIVNSYDDGRHEIDGVPLTEVYWNGRSYVVDCTSGLPREAFLLPKPGETVGETHTIRQVTDRMTVRNVYTAAMELQNRQRRREKGKY